MAKVNTAATFFEPISAQYHGGTGTSTGQPVTLLAVGDLEGMSPGYLFVNGEGRSEWAPINQFTIQDPKVRPNLDRELAGRR